MKHFFTLLFTLSFLTSALAIEHVGGDQKQRIYTKPNDADAGGITGQLGVGDLKLTHAIAVDQRLAKVFFGKIEADGKSFKWEHLPVAKYDIVLVTTNGRVYEGLTGEGKTLDQLEEPLKGHLTERISKMDAFFNRWLIHRAIVTPERALVFTERIRDNPTLTQAGENLDAAVRRLEIADLQLATDDWQMVNTRHIYREEASGGKGVPFLKHYQVPALGNIRVITTVKDLGKLSLPQ